MAQRQPDPGLPGRQLGLYPPGKFRSLTKAPRLLDQRFSSGQVPAREQDPDQGQVAPAQHHHVSATLGQLQALLRVANCCVEFIQFG